MARGISDRITPRKLTWEHYLARASSTAKTEHRIYLANGFYDVISCFVYWRYNAGDDDDWVIT